MTRIVTTIAFLCITASVSIAQTRQLRPANTVRELLQVNGVDNLAGLPPEIGRMYIGNGNLRYYAMEGDDREFVFAGYVLPELPDGNSQPADQRIHVVLADRTSGRLRYGVISPAGCCHHLRFAGRCEPDILPGTLPRRMVECPGPFKVRDG